MKKIMPYVANVFFSLFGLGVIILLMSYTFEALAYIFPNNFTAQVMGMVLFDIASLAWLSAFIYLCKSVMQYTFAFIGFVFGVLGSLAMVSVDVMLSGQEMVTPPVWINGALIYGFIFAAVAHVVLIYAYKLAAPEISADISMGFETAQITEEGMKQAEAELLKERGALGRIIAPRLMNNVRRNLGLPVYGDVIELTAMDASEQPIPVQMPAVHQMSFLERVRAAGQVLINPAPAVSQQYKSNMSAPMMPTQQVDPQPTESRPISNELKQDDNAKVGDTKESEAAELQPVPLPLEFSGNGNGNGHK